VALGALLGNYKNAPIPEVMQLIVSAKAYIKQEAEAEADAAWWKALMNLSEIRNG